MTATRIYSITDGAGKKRLVEATHPSHALRHVAAGAFAVRVAGQHELVDLLRRGVNVESIAGEQAELPTS